MFTESASIHSSAQKRTARSLLSSSLAWVVLPEPDNPQTMINLGPVLDASIDKLSVMNRFLARRVYSRRERLQVKPPPTISRRLRRKYFAIRINSTLNPATWRERGTRNGISGSLERPVLAFWGAEFRRGESVRPAQP